MPYFIHEDGNQSGPYTIEELKQKRISASTPVWTDGLSEWVAASRVTELKEVITQAPPPFTQLNPVNRPAGSFQQPNKTKSNWSNSLRLIVAIVLVTVAVLYLISHFYHRPPGPYSALYTSTIDLEHAYPTTYLAAGGTYRQNFWQTEEEITGTITNKALHTNYKDIHIRVNFYSQTKTIIGTQDYIIYEYVPYGSTQPFTLKVNKPTAAASCGWVPTGASYY
jgi:hypothetical protein